MFAAHKMLQSNCDQKVFQNAGYQQHICLQPKPIQPIIVLTQDKCQPGEIFAKASKRFPFTQ